MKVHAGSTRGRGGGRGGRGGRGGGRGRGGGDVAPPASDKAKRAPESRDVAGKVAPKGGDRRFAARTSDPRFAKLQAPQRENRSRGADPRFAGVKNISGARVDARGRPLPANEFDASDEEDEEEDDAAELVSGDACSAGSFEEGDEESGEEDASGDADDDDVLPPDAVEADLDDDDVIDFDESDVETIEATSRIAVVNCDWDHVRAVDIFAIFFHTLPLGGRLLDVKVYLSDFGKERLEYERSHGPDLWTKAAAPEEQARVAKENAATIATINKEAEMVELAKEAEDEADSSDCDDPQMFAEIGDGGEMFSGGKFRKYELDRMKYYYAVARFDTPETAAAVYEACDGMDIEASGVILDLRYVPEEETFDEARVQNRATRIPPNFKPLKSFKAAALSQTRFRISWDQDDPHRKQSLKDAFTDDTDEANLNAYLASDTSDDEDEAGTAAEAAAKERRAAKRAEIRRKYAALLEDVGGAVDELPDDGPMGAEDEAAGSDDDGGVVGQGAFGTDDEDSDDDIAMDGEFGDDEEDDEEEGDFEDDEEEEDDDDDLNRFDDVEFGDPFSAEVDAELAKQDADDDDGEVLGNVEGKINMSADDRAQEIATALRRAKEMKGADLGQVQKLKYKLRRKMAKADKKEALRQQRELQDAEAEAHADEHRDMLRNRLGDTVEERRQRAKGKQARKELAKQKRAEARKEHAEHKRRRAVARIAGNSDAVREGADEAAAEQIEDRFRGRLLNDPRFHIDPSSERARKNKDVRDLATSVSAARRVSKTTPSQQPEKATAAATDAADVDFFVKRAQGKKRA